MKTLTFSAKCRRICIFAIAAMILGTGVNAQTQQGVVKTRGRMVGGKLVPGILLAGATVQVEGRQAVLAKDGKFSVPVKDGKFIIKSVSKQGYQLVDADACRQYSYSAMPLTMVMEPPDKQMSDKLAAERRIRRQLQDQLRQREDEIEELREQSRITDEQYRNALQELYAKQENNEKLIADMARRYSELDYDQLDEFQRQVSYCIENGQLSKADSLLRRRGDVAQQVQATLKAGAALQQQRAHLNKAEAVQAAQIDEMARRCYSYYEMFAARFQTDSAVRYLLLRASLDTTNVEWQLEAGKFLLDYIADHDKALNIYNIALRQASAKYGQNSGETARVFSYIGELFFAKRNLSAAMDYTKKSLAIAESVYGKNNIKVASEYNSIAMLHSVQGELDNAMDYYTKALHILDSVEENDYTTKASIYSNLGYLFYQKGDFTKALEYHKKTLEICNSSGRDDNLYVATSYNNIGLVYDEMGEAKNSIEYYQKSAALSKKILGERHPNVASLYSNIGGSYAQIGEYDKALDCLNKSVDIRKVLFGAKSVQMAISYNELGHLYNYQKNYKKALPYFNESLAILESSFGNKHPYVITLYNTLGKVYYDDGDYAKSLEWLQKAKSALEQLPQPDKDVVKKVNDMIEEVKTAQLKIGQNKK